MAKTKFEFAPLTAIPQQEETPQSGQYATEKETKVTFNIGESLQEKLKDWGYWEGLTQQDIIIEALAFYFKDKTTRPRPDKIKNKKKVGRKPLV